MSAWRGKDGNFCSNGMPHVTKIARKPKGVGAELKDAADSETMLHYHSPRVTRRGRAYGSKEVHRYLSEYKGTAQTL
jgi:hypothetical protein